MLRKSALLTSFVVALAACGSGGDAVKSSEGAATSASSSTTSSTEGVPQDPNERALAENGLLTLADLPSGFTQKPRPKDDGDDELDAAMAKIPGCAGLKELIDGHGTGEVKSPHFDYGSDVSLSNEVEIFATTAGADAELGTIPAPTTVACLQQALQMEISASLAKKQRSGTTPINAITVTGGPVAVSGFGDSAVGIEFTMTVDAGRKVNLYFQIIGVKVGRALASYSFEDSDAHTLGTLRDRVIRATSERLRAS